MALPKNVIMPGPSLFRDVEGSGQEFMDKYRQYVYNTLLDVGCVPQMDDSMQRLSWAVMPMFVDGVEIGIDFSDYNQFSIPLTRVAYQFRIQHTPAFEHFDNVGSFPQYSYLDWAWYRELATTIQHCDVGGLVSGRMNIDATNPEKKTARRLAVHRILLHHCGSRLQSGMIPLEEFLPRTLACRVHVHVPGSWPNMMDRVMPQLWSFGMPIICTEIFTTCCGVRPEPGVHYIRMRDDFSDLPAVIDWCDQHPAELVQIGRNAKQYFEEHCLPAAIWTYICDCLATRVRPATQGKEQGDG